MTIIQFEVGKSKTTSEVHRIVVEGDDIRRIGANEDEADLTMAMSRAEFESVLAGTTSLDVGYMTGTIKVTGNMGRMLSLMPILTSDSFSEQLARAQSS